MERLPAICLLVLLVCADCKPTYALPPLGLTQVSPSPTSLSNLEFIGESAYLGVPGGVWSVNSSDVHVRGSTRDGYALGGSHVPGTLGAAPALWTPAGEFSFVAGNGVDSTIRDRLDGQGSILGFPFRLVEQVSYTESNLGVSLLLVSVSRMAEVLVLPT